MALYFYPEPTVEETEVRERTRDFLATAVLPTFDEDDKHSHFRRGHLEELGKRNLLGMRLPASLGGDPKPLFCYFALIEEISRVSPALAITVAVTHLTQGCIYHFGNEEQKRTYLPDLAKGLAVGAFSLSEPGSGSDAASLKTTAKSSAKGYTLNGNKLWCSTAGHADLYVVMARTSPDRKRGVSAFVVTKDTPGFWPGKMERKLGMHASPLAELIFENCEVSSSQRLGEEGEGLNLALSQLDFGRLGVAAASLGLAIGVLETAQQLQNKSPLAPEEFFQPLATHYARIQAVKSLLWDAATLSEQKKKIGLLAAQAKLLASDLAMEIATEAINQVGSSAVVERSPLEHFFRDAKALQIVEGTNQIQRIILARALMKDQMP